MKESLLWELSKEGFQKSFVFGTMHVKSQRAFHRLDLLGTILKHVEVFAAEYDLDQLRSTEDGSFMRIPEEQTISGFLGKQKYKRIQNAIHKAFGVDIAPLDRIYPLLIVNLIGESTLSSDFSLPLDVYLWEMSKGLSLRLEGIETFESQQRIFQKIKLKDQVKMLKDLSRNTSKYRKSINRMASLYEDEQIRLLYKQGRKSLGKYKNLLLYSRNHIMAKRFEQIAKEDQLLFAIGAGHLAGKYGVLKLLKNKDWKIKPI